MQAISALSDRLQSVLRLQTAPTIVSETPSTVADSPSVAIWPEEFDMVWSQEEELTVDVDGELRVGAYADLTPPAGAAVLDDGSHLSHVGTQRVSGRIFVGCRLPPRRAEIQEKITREFALDTPGVMHLQIDRPRVGSQILPWPWTVGVSVESAAWTPEMVFAERLFAWIEFDMEIAVLIDRREPLMTELVIAMLAGPVVDVSTPAPQAVQQSELYQITSDGDVVPYTEE